MPMQCCMHVVSEWYWHWLAGRVKGDGVHLPLLSHFPNYSWRELPQVSFLSRQNVCHDKRFVSTSIHLSWQTRFCRDKTRLLSRQTYACRDKTFVATNTCLSRQKYILSRIKMCFVMTNTWLSRQNFCPEKNDTCDSCRQRYQTALHQEGEDWPNLSVFSIHCLSCKTNKAATFNIAIDSMKFPLQSRVSFVVDSVKQLFRTKWWFLI